jgi:trimethylamine--corrinoid protein Co-methyltransferase
VILGSLPAFFDMKSLQDFFDPHSMLLDVACAEIMAYYRIPHAGISGCGIGWSADLAAGGQLWTSHLLGLLGRSGLAPFVGGTLGSKAFSPLLAVYSNDVIGQAVRMAEGFPVGIEELDLDTVLAQGPGGSFLTSRLTMARFRDAYYQSELMPRISLESWEKRGRPRFEDILREQTMELLQRQELVEDHDEIIARGEALIQGSR